MQYDFWNNTENKTDNLLTFSFYNTDSSGVPCVSFRSVFLFIIYHKNFICFHVRCSPPLSLTYVSIWVVLCAPSCSNFCHCFPRRRHHNCQDICKYFSTTCIHCWESSKVQLGEIRLYEKFSCFICHTRAPTIIPVYSNPSSFNVRKRAQAEIVNIAFIFGMVVYIAFTFGSSHSETYN
jgi:hypothetical protein